MIEIFIPVLWICINAKCEFMQSTGYFRKEDKCLENLAVQKNRMVELVKEAGQGRIEVLEGTCVDAQVKITSQQTVGVR